MDSLHPAVIELIDAVDRFEKLGKRVGRAREDLYAAMLARTPEENPVGIYQYLGKQVKITEAWAADENCTALEVKDAEDVVVLDVPVV